MTDEFAQYPESDDPDRALADVLTPEAMLEQVRLRRAEGTYRQCNAAAQLLEWYGRLRGPAEIAAVLRLLHKNPTGHADECIVIQAVALGRTADESAQIAHYLAVNREQGSGTDAHTRISTLVAASRPAQDVADFVCTLTSAQSTGLAETVVAHAAQRRSMDTIARLELTLRARDQSDAASRLVSVALDRRNKAEEIAELIDFQLAYGPTLTHDTSISEPVATHIRDQMPQEKLVDLVMRQYRRDPGRALAWSAGVVESTRRPITTVVELYAAAAANQYSDLAEKVTITVAKHRRAEDLIAYTNGCLDKGADVFELLFNEVSMGASAETVSNLIQLWNARQSAKGEKLRKVLAARAPAATLIAAAVHLADRTWVNLSDDLLRIALEQPCRFQAAEVAALLAGIRKPTGGTVRSRRGDVAKSVIQKLSEQLSPAPGAAVDVGYFAELTCAIAEKLAEDRAVSARALIGSAMFDHGDKKLPERYYDALRLLGRNDLAEEFRRTEIGTMKWNQIR